MGKPLEFEECLRRFNASLAPGQSKAFRPKYDKRKPKGPPRQIPREFIEQALTADELTELAERRLRSRLANERAMEGENLSPF